MLDIAFITYYGYIIGFDWNGSAQPHLYWLLLAFVLPNYYWLQKKSPNGSFMTFHHWMIPMSISTLLAPLVGFDNILFNFLLFNSLYGFYINFGQIKFTSSVNGYIGLGALGTIIMFLMGSFRIFWQELFSLEDYYIDGFGIAYNIIFLATAIGILIWRYGKDSSILRNPLNYMFIAYIPIFFIAMSSSLIAMLLCNLIVAVLGIMIILEAVKNDNLGTLNLGLFLISVLIVCRYFDMNIPFVLRGILFILIGVGFFIANYLMFQKRKAQEANKD